MDNKFVIEISSIRDLASKDASSKLYFTLTLLDSNGGKIGTEMKTRTFKTSALSGSPVQFQFSTSDGFAGIGLLLVSKGFFKDHQIGQLTLKFNTKLLSGTQVVDDFFPISSRKAGATAGRVSMKIASEAALSNANAPGGSSSSIGDLDSSSSEEKPADAPVAPPPSGSLDDACEPAPKPSLTLSSKWKANDDKLRTSAVVIVEEDDSVSDEMPPFPREERKK